MSSTTRLMRLVTRAARAKLVSSTSSRVKLVSSTSARAKLVSMTRSFGSVPRTARQLRVELPS